MISGSVEIWRPAYLCNVEALEWLSAHAESMYVDPARLILWGDSAGGGIAAGAALMARDMKSRPPLAKQILIYPMLDDRTTFPED